jgi:hypothetical protein
MRLSLTEANSKPTGNSYEDTEIPGTNTHVFLLTPPGSSNSAEYVAELR